MSEGGVLLVRELGGMRGAHYFARAPEAAGRGEFRLETPLCVLGRSVASGNFLIPLSRELVIAIRVRSAMVALALRREALLEHLSAQADDLVFT